MDRSCLNCRHWIADQCCNKASVYYGCDKDDMTTTKPCYVWEDNNETVNHPSHYQGQHECIDIMRVMFGDEAVKGFCRCNAYKYRYRAGRKDGNTAEQDIAKAEWYEEYLIRMEEESNDDD